MGGHGRRDARRLPSGPARSCESRHERDHAGRDRPRLPRPTSEIEYDEADGVFSFALPGEKKLQTAVRLDVGPHALGVHAFVCRKPDENHEQVYRWLLERNLRMYAVAFGVDPLGDIYLDARLPLAAVTADELDRLLGSVLSYADESFNTILELGFASSIRKEWEWRRSAASRPTTSRRSAAGSRRRGRQRASRTAPRASSAGNACTARIRTLTVARRTPGDDDAGEEEDLTSSCSDARPQTRPATRKPL